MQRGRKPNLRNLRQRSGAATVEMALAAPILVALVFGIIQVAYAFMVQHAIQNAAAKGCRAGTLTNRSSAAVTSAVNNTLQPIGLSNYATVTICVNNVATDASTAVSGDYVSVQVAIPLSNVTLFPGLFNNWNGTLVGGAGGRCQ